MPEEPQILRRGKGDFELRIPAPQRELLRRLPGEMKEVLASGHPATKRLFPNAYPNDAERAKEFDEMVRSELVAGRKHSLEVMESTIDETSLNEDQMASWLGSLNDLRLFLGTSLDVSEESFDEQLDADDPAAGAMALYQYLGWLQELVVRALSEDLPPSVDPDDDLYV